MGIKKLEYLIIIIIFFKYIFSITVIKKINLNLHSPFTFVLTIIYGKNKHFIFTFIY